MTSLEPGYHCTGTWDLTASSGLSHTHTPLSLQPRQLYFCLLHTPLIPCWWLIRRAHTQHSCIGSAGHTKKPGEHSIWAVAALMTASGSLPNSPWVVGRLEPASTELPERIGHLPETSGPPLPPCPSKSLLLFCASSLFPVLSDALREQHWRERTREGLNNLTVSSGGAAPRAQEVLHPSAGSLLGFATLP